MVCAQITKKEQRDELDVRPLHPSQLLAKINPQKQERLFL